MGLIVKQSVIDKAPILKSPTTGENYKVIRVEYSNGKLQGILRIRVDL